jgi:hypothetical protein
MAYTPATCHERASTVGTAGNSKRASTRVAGKYQNANINNYYCYIEEILLSMLSESDGSSQRYELRDYISPLSLSSEVLDRQALLVRSPYGTKRHREINDNNDDHDGDNHCTDSKKEKKKLKIESSL